MLLMEVVSILLNRIADRGLDGYGRGDMRHFSRSQLRH